MTAIEVNRALMRLNEVLGAWGRAQPAMHQIGSEVIGITIVPAWIDEIVGQEIEDYLDTRFDFAPKELLG